MSIISILRFGFFSSRAALSRPVLVEAFWREPEIATTL